MTTTSTDTRSTRCGGHTVHWLDDGRQRLGLVPAFGGSAGTWLLHPQAHAAPGLPEVPFHLWRPWFGEPDPFSVASLPLVPWSNRISGGGFEQDGVFHPLTPNRTGERCPIHGEGWLQAWDIVAQTEDQIELRLDSRHFMGSPYDYTAVQHYRLLPDGIEQTLSVTHRGEHPLPYGLGQHPWLLRSPGTRVRARVGGVWLSLSDRLPRAHAGVPPEWDLSAGIEAHGTLIDNAFTGWDGTARVEWPETGWALTVEDSAATGDGCLLLFRPEAGPSFCVEPVSHPIDAVHLPGRPGLRHLEQGDSMTMRLRWRFARLHGDGAARSCHR